MATPGIVTIEVLSADDLDDVHEFGIDTSFQPYRREAFRARSIPAQREGVAQTNIPGQGTVSTEGLWRREQVEWSMGAGQYSLDRKGEDQSTRFYSSQGVDVFSYPLRATLLPDTHSLIANAGGNLLTTTCNGYLVVAAAGAVKYYSNSGGTWNTGSPTSCTAGSTYGGSGWTQVYSMTSNDTYVYIATDAGIWFCNIGVSGGNYITAASVFQLYAANDTTAGYTHGYSLVRWCNDQLIASSQQILYAGTSYGNRLYAFQPRAATAATGVAGFGAPPILGSVNAAISTMGLAGTSVIFVSSISGSGSVVTVNGTNQLKAGDYVTLSGFSASAFNMTDAVVASATSSSFTISSAATGASSSGTAYAYDTVIITTAPHNASVGQSITVTGSQVVGNNTGLGSTSISAVALVSGTMTVTVGTGGTGVAGVTVGETVSVTLYTVAVPNGRTEKVIVTNIPSPGKFSFHTSKWGTTGLGSNAGSGLLYGVYSGSTAQGYGGNQNFIVKGVLSATIIDVGNGPSAAAGPSVGGTVTSLANTTYDLLSTHPNPNWVWSDATEGQTQVYFAGYVSTGTTKGGGGVYRSDLLGSSTTQASNVQTITSSSVFQPWQLNVPIEALPMSQDEYPTSIKSYLNYIFVGTNRGIRMCQTLSIYDPTATATGDLKAGPLIPNILQPLTNPVTAIVGDGRYVWWAWNNYTGSVSGLGKLDLTTFIAGDQLAPAYASDLMYYTLGPINSLTWDPYNNVPLAAVQSSGVWTPYAKNLGQGGNIAVTKYVGEGSVTSGIFDYGIPDPKIPIEFDYVASNSSSSSVSAQVILDPGDADTSTLSVASYSAGGNPRVLINTAAYTQANQFQSVVTLVAGSGQTTTPQLHRWVVKSFPAIVQPTNIMAVLKMWRVDENDGEEYYRAVASEYVWLETRRDNADVILYTEGELTVVGVITDLDKIPHEKIGTYEGGFEGDIVCTIRTLGLWTYTAAPT